MVEASFRQVDKGDVESDEELRLEREEKWIAEWEPEDVKLAERIEDAMRKVQMAERLLGMGTDTPVGDDNSCWKTLPLWDVKLGEVDPKTGRRRQPFDRKKQLSYWKACPYCQIGMGACAAFPSRSLPYSKEYRRLYARHRRRRVHK